MKVAGRGTEGPEDEVRVPGRDRLEGGSHVLRKKSPAGSAHGRSPGFIQVTPRTASRVSETPDLFLVGYDHSHMKRPDRLGKILLGFWNGQL